MSGGGRVPPPWPPIVRAGGVALAGFAGLTGLMACDPYRPLEGVPAPDMAAYTDALEARTREVKVYEGLSTALIARATWVDAPLADAQSQALDRMRLGTPGEIPSAPAIALGAWSDRSGRLVLGVGPTAEWQIRLLVDGQECAFELERRSPSSTDRVLYPWLTVWNDLWLLDVGAECPGAGQPEVAAILQISGPWASAELRW